VCERMFVYRASVSTSASSAWVAAPAARLAEPPRGE
jgi:hypothetical protein